MRLRHATLAIAALTMLGVAGCGDDPDDTPAPGTPAPGASVAASGTGAPGDPSAPAGDTSASPTTPPTEGTVPSKAPKKGGEANQGPAGRGAGSPDVLSAAGLGPYEIGATQNGLKSDDLLGKVSTKDACATAKGLSAYGTPALAFTKGKLQRLTVTSSKIATVAGAKVGTSYASLKGMHPAGKQLDDWVGASAWYTLDGGNALLFRISDGKVASIDAGADPAVQFFYTDKQGC
jgi:hypothetical protein